MHVIPETNPGAPTERKGSAGGMAMSWPSVAASTDQYVAYPVVRHAPNPSSIDAFVCVAARKPDRPHMKDDSEQ